MENWEVSVNEEYNEADDAALAARLAALPPLRVFPFETAAWKREHVSFATWCAKIDRENAKRPALKWRATERSKATQEALSFLAGIWSEDYAKSVLRSEARWAIDARTNALVRWADVFGVPYYNWTRAQSDRHAALERAFKWLREGMTPSAALAKLREYRTKEAVA